jgi:serine/threonine protein kinase
MAGTPLYASPEAISQPDRVDARTDVYATGAVGYYLLTGSPVFTGTTVVEICMQHINAVPEPPSARSGKPISRGLEELLLRCLSKSPSDRPSDAASLLSQLEACAITGTWTACDAAVWWVAHEESARSTEGAVSVTIDQAPAKQRPTLDATMAYEGDTRKP